ncbi:MAG: family NAD(P)-dependent oxidoreductase [Hydrocarboniphaga sp.]|uniref:oxidoreductase n=1 Tax=Hydrocarboniphaga sp. TaxID=2033016 RepID=UPI0026103209|nr:oxidoreductase [Hydrocarboniphaga sp.]MDB5969716.1 family NAD(P)-dependent oxidoreductase [Hydrocarboniphaga sp.]
MAAAWTLADMPSQLGRVALVTGANRGLGWHIADALAGAGAHVVMACRDANRAEAAASAIRSRHPAARLEILPLDLASLASVRQCAERFGEQHPRLDLLIHNGAAILVPKGQTLDGFETHLGVNHFAPFVLTGLLLDHLQTAPSARVVNTASLAHRLTPGLDLSDPNFEHRPYKDMDAYGASKIAALLFTLELDRRLQRAGSKIVAATAHPGYSNTNPETGGFWLRLATRLFAQKPGIGALPALYAATAAEVRGNDYFGPGGFKELGGSPKRVGMRDEAKDPQLAAQLWDLSERMTGIRYLNL